MSGLTDTGGRVAAGADEQNPDVILSMEGIVKWFGDTCANDRVDFSLQRGEVHALLGENGAGKSTLMGVLAGVHRMDAGRILLDGQTVRITDPAAAKRLGIGMVFQHFMLVPSMNVTENVILSGAVKDPGGTGERRPGFLLPLAGTAKMIREFSDMYGLGVDPDARVGGLSVGEQQRVEILKVLCGRSRILVLDEPTAVLTPDEAEGLFHIIRRLVAQGDRSVVFITHKLKEVMAVCDRITVLRGGRNVAVCDKSATGMDELGRLMVGREVKLGRRVRGTIGGGTTAGGDGGTGGTTARGDTGGGRGRGGVGRQTGTPQPARGTPDALRLEGVRYADAKGVLRLDIDDLIVKPGEILGIAGVDGNGQSQLAALCTGAIAPQAGKVYVCGEDMWGGDPGEKRKPFGMVRAGAQLRFLRSGVSHIPEDRRALGLVPPMGIHENLVLRSIDSPAFASAWGWRLKHGEILRHAKALIEMYDIRPADALRPVEALSGGNQQKVVLAREMEAHPRLLVAAHPTRGVDIGATEFIHAQILAARESGCALLLISADLDEILALADRMAVMYEGRIMGYADPAWPDMGAISLMMAGKG
jgi:simple sugar transport system ATP-binding protein